LSTSLHNLQPPRAFSNPLLAIVRLVLICFWCLFCCLRHFCQWCIRYEVERLTFGRETACRFFKGALVLMGIRVHVKGIIPSTPVLFAPNHISYMDILAVGAVCPTFFLSKAGVAKWPVVGRLFRISQSLTINRSLTRAVKEVNLQMAERFSAGHSMCVFLEGTTTNGTKMLPFHSSLLQCIIDSGFQATPIAIKWYSDNPAINIKQDVAYWGEHVIGPHAFRLLGLRGIEVTLQVGEPVSTEPNQDRKEFAQGLRATVASMQEAN